MIQIYTNGGLLYDPRLADPIHLRYLAEAKMEIALNKAGGLTVTVPEQNPQYGSLTAPTSEIWVLQDDVEIFRGRVREIHEDLNGLQEVVVEGLKAYLRDEYLRPYAVDDYGGTVAGWLGMAVDVYNDQRSGRDFVPFAVGTVDAQQLDIEGRDYKRILDAIDGDLLKAVGGYLFVARANGQNVISWSLTPGPIDEQVIAYGVNLTGYKRDDSAGDLFTAVIPLGKADGDNGKLTIKTVNAGSDMLVDATAAARDGLIVKVVDHSDIEDAQTLKDAGQEDLANAGSQAVSIEATAVDLADAGVDVGRLRLGHRNPVRLTRTGPETILPISKISVDLLAPDSGRYTFSQQYQTLTQQQLATATAATAAAATAANAATSQSVAQQIQQSESKYSDWVAETGTTDGWTWHKWSSGLRECWRVVEIEIPAAGYTAWGSVFAYSATVPYPANFFSAAPALSASPCGGSGCWTGMLRPSGHTAAQAALSVLRAQNTTAATTVRVELHAYAQEANT